MNLQKAKRSNNNINIKNKMKSKKDILKEGLDPKYIEQQAKAIVKEMKKDNVSLAYIREKADNIKRFLKGLEK